MSKKVVGGGRWWSYKYKIKVRQKENTLFFMAAIRRKENALSLELREGLIWQLTSQIKDNHHCKMQYWFNALITKEGNRYAK